MPEHIEGIDEPPLFFPCDVLARQFPAAWRDIRFRRSATRTPEGQLLYYCPICKAGFDHTDIEYLQGDHIWPYSLFGETSWANYQLICGSCNARKRDFLEDAIRQILGEGRFRKSACDYLRIAANEGRISRTALVTLLLSRDDADQEGR